jgi:23S rRNA pseudouridine2605 synthase
LKPIKKQTPAPPSPSQSKPEPAPQAERPLQAERLQKLLAAAGLGSRRQIETWIEAGRVTLAGRPAKLGDRALPTDAIEVDGKPVAFQKTEAARVLVYYKPVGELVTRSDPQGRPNVFTRLPAGRWVAVGRLDINSAGLLLFTDSGELANRLMHPRYEIDREYVARVHGRISPEALEKLRTGIHLEDGVAAFVSIREEGVKESTGSNKSYRVVLREGRNREVRRLFEAVGARVNRLLRVRYGPVRLPEDLAPGGWREIKNPVILQKL